MIYGIYIFSLLVLIYSRVKKNNKLGLIFKVILGLLFLFEALYIFFNKKIDMIGYFIIISLVLNLLCDTLLACSKLDYKNIDFYLIFSIILVLCSQIICFIVSVLLSHVNFFALFLSFIFCLTILIGIQKFYKIKKIVLIFVYFFILTNVFFNTMLNYIVSLESSMLLYTIGTFLYWISDILLFYIKFIKNNIVMDIINKVLYYSAQMIIAHVILLV